MKPLRQHVSWRIKDRRCCHCGWSLRFGDPSFHVRDRLFHHRSRSFAETEEKINAFPNCPTVGVHFSENGEIRLTDENTTQNYPIPSFSDPLVNVCLVSRHCPNRWQNRLLCGMLIWQDCTMD